MTDAMAAMNARRLGRRRLHQGHTTTTAGDVMTNANANVNANTNANTNMNANAKRKRKRISQTQTTKANNSTQTTNLWVPYCLGSPT
jgi:hypothetical protein